MNRSKERAEMEQIDQRLRRFLATELDIPFDSDQETIREAMEDFSAEHEIPENSLRYRNNVVFANTLAAQFLNVTQENS